MVRPEKGFSESNRGTGLKWMRRKDRAWRLGFIHHSLASETTLPPIPSSYPFVASVRFESASGSRPPSSGRVYERFIVRRTITARLHLAAAWVTLRPMAKTSKARADQLLVERGLAESRTRAQAPVMAGQVYSGTRRIDRRRSGTKLAVGARGLLNPLDRRPPNAAHRRRPAQPPPLSCLTSKNQIPNLLSSAGSNLSFRAQ